MLEWRAGQIVSLMNIHRPYLLTWFCLESGSCQISSTGFCCCCDVMLNSWSSIHSCFLQNFCFFFPILTSGKAGHKRGIVPNNYPAGFCSRSETASLIISCCWTYSFTSQRSRRVQADVHPQMFRNSHKKLENVSMEWKKSRLYVHIGVHRNMGKTCGSPAADAHGSHYIPVPRTIAQRGMITTPSW